MYKRQGQRGPLFPVIGEQVAQRIGAQHRICLLYTSAPDLAQEIELRALVLERIGALQPVGRRQLAARLNLPEREVRTVATLLPPRYCDVCCCRQFGTESWGHCSLNALGH